MFKTTLSIIATLAIFSSTTTAYDFTANNNAKKDIVPVPKIDTTQSSNSVYGGSYIPTEEQNIAIPQPSSNFENIIYYASGAKDNYRVGEPIKIKLKLKREAYIYFWTISHDGRGYLILPNNFIAYNKYRANMHYVVPERSATYDFVSDRAGVEKVYVLATNKKIDTQTLKSIFSQRAGGVIPMATNKLIKKFISKDIHAIAKRENLSYDITSFEIKIYDKSKMENSQNININIRNH